MDFEKPRLCKCGNPAGDMHSCPYASDINDDDDPEYCNCCEDCTLQCVEEI
jgi:hypothetical protein